MVQVPVTPGRTREVQPLGDERFRYSKSRNLLGPALQDLGQSMGQAANAWDEIEATYDEADALRIDNEHAAYERQRLRTGENAYLNTNGFTAGEGMEATVKDIKSSAENLLGSARSQRAREMAKRALDRRLGQAETEIAKHATTQMGVAREAQSLARIDGAVEDAVNARGTDQFAVNLGLAQMELGQRAQRLGWSPEQRQQAETQLVEGTYARTVLAIDSEDGEPTRALEFLEANKAALGTEQEGKLRNMLNPRVDAAWADQVVASGELAQFLPEVDPLAPLPQGDSQPVTIAGAPGVVGAELSKAKFSPAVVAGFLGNFEVEGGYGGGRGDGGSASGIAQWRNERRSNFKRMFGKEPHQASADEQARFVVWEMENPEKAGMTRKQRDAILAAGTPEEAAELIDRFYERSSGAHRNRRVEAAKRMFTGEAGAPGVAADPRLNASSMREAVDRYVSANPDISERRKQSLYAAADRSVANARADRAQAEQDADRRLMDWLTKNKPGADDLTDIGQIPAAVLAGASPSTVASLTGRVQATQSRIESRRQAAAAERAEQLEESAVFQLYSLTDDELATTDLRKFVGIVDQKTLGPWVDRQQALQKGGDKKPVNSDRIAGKLDQYGKPYGASRSPDAKPEERKAWIKLREFVESRIQGRPNAEVSDEDLRAIIINGMEEVQVKVEKKGLLWSTIETDSVRRIDAPAGARGTFKIQPSVRQRIEAGLRASGVNPTPELIFDAYREGVARGIYEPAG